MDRWAYFSAADLDELALSLDHRLAEAEAGNAYVYTHVVGPLLLDLYEHHPEQLAAGETIEDVRERVAVFDQIGTYEQITGAPSKLLRPEPVVIHNAAEFVETFGPSPVRVLGMDVQRVIDRGVIQIQPEPRWWQLRRRLSNWRVRRHVWTARIPVE